ncbi:MAG: putative zinc-binding metallopeptidase [Mycobacterium sp.]
MAFENSVCLSCGSALGYSVEHAALLVIASGSESEHGGAVDSSEYRRCVKDGDAEALAAVARAEKAKRGLIAELVDLTLPIVGRDEEVDYGLAFDLLSSTSKKVFTGHDSGESPSTSPRATTCTANSCAGRRTSAYRTLLGHVRHEVGH